MLTKFAPATVRANPGAPAVAPEGCSAAIEGAFTANGTAFDITGVLVFTPPDWDTVIATFCAVTSRFAGTLAVSCVGETKVVERGTAAEPDGFHTTTDPGTTTLIFEAGGGVKFVPFTVSCTPEIPAAVLLGTTDVIVGAGPPVVMRIVSAGVMVLLQTSNIATVNGKLPAFAGVPVIVRPSAEKDSPSGNAPERSLTR